MSGPAWVTLLEGPAWVELGAIGVAHLDGRLALALSRGLHPKGYAYVDPNEDAVLAAAGEGGRLLAVLDGHRGYDAAGAAAAALREVVPGLVGAAPAGEAEVAAALRWARDAVRAAVARPGAREASRTALTLALVRDGRAVHGTWGDTALLRLGRRRPEVLSRAGPFLGPGAPVPKVGVTRLRPGDRLIAASDGLSGFAGPRWAELAAERAHGSAAETATELVSLAGEYGAGDNVAIGVLIHA